MSEDLTEALTVLGMVLSQVCWDKEQNAWNSVAVPPYADGLRLLARHGMVHILADDKRSHVIAEPWQ